jgi:hypothetical protein
MSEVRQNPTDELALDALPVGALVLQSLANLRNTKVACETVLAVLTGGFLEGIS